MRRNEARIRIRTKVLELVPHAELECHQANDGDHSKRAWKKGASHEWRWWRQLRKLPLEGMPLGVPSFHASPVPQEGVPRALNRPAILVRKSLAPVR